MNLPAGAEQIIAARKKGKVPSDPLMILVGGALNFSYSPVVRAVPGKSYDWVWVRGIESYVIGESRFVSQQLMGEIAKRIGYPMLNFFHTDTGAGGYCSYLPNMFTVDLPTHQWKWVLEVTEWTDYENKCFANWLSQVTAKEDEFAAH